MVVSLKFRAGSGMRIPFGESAQDLSSSYPDPKQATGSENPTVPFLDLKAQSARIRAESGAERTAGLLW
jgi:hypothetical protein